MAKTQVGGLRTTSSRVESSAAVGGEPDLSPQIDKQFKHVFQSRKSGFLISLKRRKITTDPYDQSRTEEVPTTEEGNRLDMVRFTDHFYRTNDDEVAAAFERMPPHIFGLEGMCWRAADLRQIQREKRADEIRAQLAADPDLAKVVALRPSEAKDWDVKNDVLREAVKVQVQKELSDEELDALTRPQ